VVHRPSQVDPKLPKMLASFEAYQTACCYAEISKQYENSGRITASPWFSGSFSLSLLPPAQSARAVAEYRIYDYPSYGRAAGAQPQAPAARLEF